jgi:YesN/AraC family two-component response regulator
VTPPAPDAGDQADEATTTILIVDDELDMRMLVRVIIDLANRGWSIVGEAADGMAAVKAWRDLNGPPVPHVIVLDNRMPELTGLEAAAEILAERPEQHIVLYSAFLDDNVRREAATIGVRECVTKDELDRLPEVIDRILA